MKNQFRLDESVSLVTGARGVTQSTQVEQGPAQHGCLSGITRRDLRVVTDFRHRLITFTIVYVRGKGMDSSLPVARNPQARAAIAATVGAGKPREGKLANG